MSSMTTGLAVTILGWRNDGNLENQGRFLLDFGAVFVRGIRELKNPARSFRRSEKRLSQA
jgi:hypothetical protein